MIVNIYGNCAVVFADDLSNYRVYSSNKIKSICASTENPSARVSQMTAEILADATLLGEFDELATAVQVARRGVPPSLPPAPLAPMKESTDG
jgi:hypothetical protein